MKRWKWFKPRRVKAMSIGLIVLLLLGAAAALWAFGGKKAPNADVILRFDDDEITLHQFYSSVFSCGGVGSGKTTSAGNWELPLLRHPSRPGFVWCVVKAEEYNRALKLIRAAGRLKDVIVIGPNGPRMDVMRYELTRRGGSPEMLAQLLDRLGLIASKASATHNQAIWSQYAVTTLRYAISLTELAGYMPNVVTCYDLIISSPVGPLSGEPAGEGQESPLVRWRRDSVCGQMLAMAEARAGRGELTEEQRALLLQCKQFWQNQLGQLGSEMRGSVIGVSLNPLTPLIFPPWSTLFASGMSDFTPEDVVERGRILLFHPSFSVLVAGTPGQLVQAMIVQMVQAACMRRGEGQGRPVVINRDEVAHLIGSGDWESRVLSVSRSHRIIHLDAVQDLQTLISAFGSGSKGREAGLSFLNNHLTKVLFSCSDGETTQVFSAMLGMSRQLLGNMGQHFQGVQGQQLGLVESMLGISAQPHIGFNQSWQPEVRPDYFSGPAMRKGGPHTDPPWTVDAVIYQAGRAFKNGKAYRKCSFRQVI